MSYETKLEEVDEELVDLSGWLEVIPPAKWIQERLNEGYKPYSHYWSGKRLMKAIEEVKDYVDEAKYKDLMRIVRYLEKVNPDLDPKRI